MDAEVLALTAITLMVFAGLAVLWIAMANRRHLREMEHRERLAMIERGLIPPPEIDPGAFETRSGLAPVSRTVSRTRSAGIMLIGLGFALILLIGFTGGDAEVGFGIGGAFAVLGASFVANALLSARNERTSGAPRDTYRRPPAPPPPPPT